MTYVSEVTKLKMSIFHITVTHDQTGFSSTDWGKVNLNSSYTTHHDPFGDGITIDTTDDYITLPAGKYYINARLGAYLNGHSWSECAIFNYDTTTKLGFEGREHTYLDYNKNPANSEHAKAYVETNSNINIQIKARAGSTSVKLSDTQYTNSTTTAFPRVLIYRLE